MIDVTEKTARERRYPARAGVVALNLIAPGLGLLRAGAAKTGLLCLFAPFALGFLITFGFGHLPINSYGNALAAFTVAILLLSVVYVVPAVLTWRASKVSAPARGWSRWYALMVMAVCVLGAWQVMPVVMHRFYRPFYAPSESMAPTIGKGDKFVVDMRWRGPLRRGEIILFQAREGVRISRVVAMAGDRIALRSGVPIVNGVPAAQRLQGAVVVQEDIGPQRASLLAEHLPGEKSKHLLLDFGASKFDDMPEAVVPQNHFYVLGDNRDQSADSRVPSDQMGVGMVPAAAIIGRPMYIYWSVNRAEIGRRLDDQD